MGEEGQSRFHMFRNTPWDGPSQGTAPDPGFATPPGASSTLIMGPSTGGITAWEFPAKTHLKIKSISAGELPELLGRSWDPQSPCFLCIQLQAVTAIYLNYKN